MVWQGRSNRKGLFVYERNSDENVPRQDIGLLKAESEATTDVDKTSFWAIPGLQDERMVHRVAYHFHGVTGTCRTKCVLSRWVVPKTVG